MNPLGISELKQNLLNKYAIDFDIVYDIQDNIPVVSLTPLNLVGFKGIKAVLRLEWRKIQGEINLGDFGRELLGELEKNQFFSSELYKTYVAIIKKDNATVQLKINGQKIDIPEEDIPGNWSSFSMRVVKKHVVIDKNNFHEIKYMVEKWSSRLAGLMVSILPFESLEHYHFDEEAGLPEGAKTTISINRYERDRANRQACIDYYGVICSICGFDHGTVYGKIGDGFIHVHHITPVSNG